MRTEKAETREELKKIALGIGAREREICSAAICARLFRLEEYRRARTIFVFVGTKREVDTAAILRQAWQEGKRVAVPRCQTMGQMTAHEISAWTDLTMGKYEIMAPMEECQAVATTEIDLAVVPCLSCDAQGHRLGYGGGFYDRFLAGSGIPAAALCMERLMSAALPAEAHDIVMDYVVTERRTIELSGWR